MRLHLQFLLDFNSAACSDFYSKTKRVYNLHHHQTIIRCLTLYKINWTRLKKRDFHDSVLPVFPVLSVSLLHLEHCRHY